MPDGANEALWAKWWFHFRVFPKAESRTPVKTGFLCTLCGRGTILFFGNEVRPQVSKIKSPREKKELSLRRDRRNTYGENSKSSRKAIPRGKQRGHMGERRAVRQILSHLREGLEQKAADEADVQAKTTIVAKKHKAFKKKPDTPLGVVVKKKLAKRGQRSGANAAQAVGSYLDFESGDAFDIPYDSRLHKRSILWELRYHAVGGRWGRFITKSRRFGVSQREFAVRWREAILRSAPLLEGFFCEEPGWREKMLHWCDRALTVSPDSDKSR
jgi:hypothetical protein